MANSIDQKVQRLIAVQVRLRWLLVIFMWLTVGTMSLWQLRADISMWLEFFTWAAVRVAIRHEQFAFLGLGLCTALTLSTLIRQSWNILFGLSKQEYADLVKTVQKIEERGVKHWLWRSLFQAKD